MPTTENLFVEFGTDHNLVAENYAEQMDATIAKLEEQFPIDVGHGFNAVATREQLGDLFAQLHPFAESHVSAEVASEIRKNLWHLAHGDTR